MDISVQTRTKLGHFITVAEAGSRLGVSAKTIRRWCESGRLPAMATRYGNSVTYQISPAALELVRQEAQQAASVREAKKKAAAKPHREYLKAWEKAMAKGLMTGRAFSPATIATYKLYAVWFMDHYAKVDEASLRRALLGIPAEMFAKRAKLYEAVICFAKFLIQESALDASFLATGKSLRPRRHIPPKKTSVDEGGIDGLLNAAGCAMDRALVVLLAGTGLRASECCALTLDDIDLEKQTLIVQRGKGGKSRVLGLTRAVVDALRVYLPDRPDTSRRALFFNALGEPLDRHGLRHRLNKLGKKAGVTVTPHSLRRSFVTVNAGKGRPLHYLQRSCGHSDIRITMGYCLTSQEEVIDAMRGWD
ncbi:MAG: tyrosine-type recombinase/integrase [Candidatus Melainabacteria bacterium]